MQDIILYLILIVIGAGIGFFVRKKRESKEPIKIITFIKTFATCTLLFVMSTRIGSNEEVSKSLGTIGIYAFLATAIIMAATTLIAFLIRKILGFNSVGSMTSAKDGSSAEVKAVAAAASGDKGAIDKTTVLIFVFVALGILVGRLFINRIFSDYEYFTNLASTTIRVWLSILLFFVGFDLGYDESSAGNLKSAGVRIVFFPIATIVGTLLGGAISFLVIPVTLREALAIAAGFGWYSLAPVIIMDAGYIMASAISFLHNVMREFFSFLLIPVIAKRIGYIEAACVPGAPGMDICLPAVERSTNSTVAIYSFISGTITSILVPILVPLFIGK